MSAGLMASVRCAMRAVALLAQLASALATT